MRIVNVVLILVLLSVGACSSRSTRTANSDAKKAILSSEIQQTFDQLDRELVSHPTRFVLPMSEARGSLERVYFFFKTYSSDFSPRGFSADSNNLNFSNERSGDKVSYRVSRVLLKDGVKYTVTAYYSVDSSKSYIFAANLARFIKEGKLEMFLVNLRK